MIDGMWICKACGSGGMSGTTNNYSVENCQFCLTHNDNPRPGVKVSCRMETRDTPPAFPYYGDGFSGMTMRDYFAAQVLPRIYTRDKWDYLDTLAKEAYKIANAMERERKRQLDLDAVHGPRPE